MIEAVEWVAGLLTGTMAVTIAILAVASIGLLLLQGRVPFVRFAKVVLGCFIVFGASTIAVSFVSFSTRSSSHEVLPPVAIEPPEFETEADLMGAYRPYPGAAAPLEPGGEFGVGVE